MRKKISTNSRIKHVVDFIKDIEEQCVIAQSNTGIPSEAILAQAALETGWGRVVKRNNFFNITAGSSWKGDTYTIERAAEYINGKWTHKKQIFRSYNTIQESIDDYCNLISGAERYSGAMKNKHDLDTYINNVWASGYATDPEYASKLKKIIIKYFVIKYI